MTDPLEELVISRILISLDMSTRGMAAIEAAAELAAQMRAELTGLFVEDVNLLRLANLPFAREVGYTSATGRPLAAPELESMLRAQAIEVRRLLASAAERAEVQWSFRVARGQLLAELLALAEAGDVLVLGKKSKTRIPGIKPGSIYAGVARSQRPAAPMSRARPVMAVFDGSIPGYRALAVACQLVRGGGRELVVLVPDSGNGGFKRLRQEAELWLAARQLKARYMAIPAISPGNVADAVRKNNGEALVLGHLTEPSSQEMLGQLVDGIDCPVFAVK